MKECVRWGRRVRAGAYLKAYDSAVGGPGSVADYKHGGEGSRGGGGLTAGPGGGEGRSVAGRQVQRNNATKYSVAIRTAGAMHAGRVYQCDRGRRGGKDAEGTCRGLK